MRACVAQRPCITDFGKTFFLWFFFWGKIGDLGANIFSQLQEKMYGEVDAKVKPSTIGLSAVVISIVLLIVVAVALCDPISFNGENKNNLPTVSHLFDGS